MLLRPFRSTVISVARRGSNQQFQKKAPQQPLLRRWNNLIKTRQVRFGKEKGSD
jgi:hypothetical protein